MIPQNPMKDAAAKQQMWSVTAVNNAIRDRLQGSPELSSIWIEAEILNVTYHSSGHIYFSLKDNQSVVRATFFKNANAAFKHIRLTNGMKVQVQGSISVYVRNGAYQINVHRIMIAGEGQLRQRIEELKQQLHNEGLLSQEKKQALPFYPVTIGVATAATGAAIQDIIRVARNRNPFINILLAPCRVQGVDASASIAGAILALNSPELNVDVIIAGRGGGSFEDLLPFNEEIAVRAFGQSRVPIVSAVGHEIDHSLTDLIADNSAATPSAAAEMLVPMQSELTDYIQESGIRMQVALRNRYQNESARLLRMTQSRVFTNPVSMLEPYSQMLDQHEERNRVAQSNIISRCKISFENLERFLPIQYKQNLNRFNRNFAVSSERLQNFSPLATLARGYSISRDKKRNVIRNTSKVKLGQEIEIILEQGRLLAEVKEIKADNLS